MLLLYRFDIYSNYAVYFWKFAILRLSNIEVLCYLYI